MSFPDAPVATVKPPDMPTYWPLDGIAIFQMLGPVREKLDQHVEQDGDAQAFHLADLQNLIGTTASALAAMHALREQARLKVLEVLGEDKAAPKQALLIRDYVKAKINGYESAYEYCDRLNAGVTHAIDASRSILSWLKQEKLVNQ